jgi:hypothetical protein
MFTHQAAAAPGFRRGKQQYKANLAKRQLMRNPGASISSTQRQAGPGSAKASIAIKDKYKRQGRAGGS